MAKNKTPSGKAAPVTGTYRYDRERGEMVLVSEGVPKVASKGRGASPASEPPCGRGACGGGRCAA